MTAIAAVKTEAVVDEQHPLLESVVLHLLPGVLMLMFFVAVAPLVDRAGVPPFTAYTLAVLFVQIPFEMGLLYHRGKKRNGRYSLEGIVCYREKLSAWRVIGLALPCLAWLFIVMYVASAPVQNYLSGNLFDWLPDWFFTDRFVENLQDYSTTGLVVGLALMWIAAVPGSLVEELYFRGYLLPRIARFGGWSPLINTVLFSLQHLSQPWSHPGMIAGFLPTAYAVWWKRSIKVGIFAHCSVVVIGFLFQTAGILALMMGWM
jgi:membrane protease YdiL (CAAX protease family)